MKTEFLLVPIIGAFTGWVIISSALRLLFWPENTVRLPFNLNIRGLFPQKRDELALGIKIIIETQVRCAVTDNSGPAPGILDKFTDTVVEAAKEHLERRIPALVPKGIKHKIAGIVEDIIRREIPLYVDTLADNMQNNNTATEDICRLAEEAIRCYDLSELEAKIAGSKEIVYLKGGAAIIGFVSGLFQILVVWLFMA